MLKKIGIILIFLTNSIFANTLPTAMNIEVISTLPTVGTAALNGNKNNDTIYGPILNPNQEKSWIITPTDEVYTVEWSKGIPEMWWICWKSTNDGYVVLDPEKYTGDTILITYISPTKYGNDYCSCSGSACSQ